MNVSNRTAVNCGMSGTKRLQLRLKMSFYIQPECTESKRRNVTVVDHLVRI